MLHGSDSLAATSGSYSSRDYGTIKPFFYGPSTHRMALDSKYDLNASSTRPTEPPRSRSRSLGAWTDATIVLRNPDDTPITLSFAYIDTVEDVGVVHVYDGSGPNAPPLARLSGSVVSAVAVTSTKGECATSQRTLARS